MPPTTTLSKGNWLTAASTALLKATAWMKALDMFARNFSSSRATTCCSFTPYTKVLITKPAPWVAMLPTTTYCELVAFAAFRALALKSSSSTPLAARAFSSASRAGSTF